MADKEKTLTAQLEGITAELDRLKLEVEILKERKPPDMTSVENRISTLEGQYENPVDLGPLEARIQTLERAGPSVEMATLVRLEDRAATLESQVLPQAAILETVSEARGMAEAAQRAAEATSATIKKVYAELSNAEPPKPFDPSEMNKRLVALEQKVGT